MTWNKQAAGTAIDQELTLWFFFFLFLCRIEVGLANSYMLDIDREMLDSRTYSRMALER